MKIKTFVNKCLSLHRLSDNWCNQLTQNIVEASRTISYVETTCPTKADTLHLAIKNSDKKTFMHEFESIVRFALAKLKLKKVKLAFDATEDLTWTKNNYNLRPSVYDRPLYSWHFLNVSIVEPFFIPLMSIPYTMFDNLDNLVIDLVGYLENLPLKIDLILFDRGFYHAHLIDYLNNKNLPYLMLIPQNSAIKKYVSQTKNFRYFKHKLSYKKDQSTWKVSTNIIIRKADENIYWSYATNQTPSLLLAMQYKKRWNIETGFRIHDEARIKSKSKNLLIRFFYHLIGMLLVLSWRLQNTIEYIIFKRFLKIVELAYIEVQIQIHPPPL